MRPPRLLWRLFRIWRCCDPLTVAYEDSRFAYQIMGGLSVRVYKRVEFRVGYRFRSNRRAEIDADLIEAGIRFRF